LTFKVDLHLHAGIGRHLEPVFAHILLAAAMVARAGLLPRAQDLCNVHDLRSPAELPRKPRLASRHPGRVDRFSDRLNRLAYEFLNHDVILVQRSYLQPILKNPGHSERSEESLKLHVDPSLRSG
jgi:hypothetical protein